MTRSRFSILSMAKDEGPRLLEWLAYHRLIGFDRIRVYSNDCRDGTDAMLDRLDAMGLVEHRRNVVPEGKKPQPHALTLGQNDPTMLATDWLIVLDVDEFLHVKAGAGALADLLDACPGDIDGMCITWRAMGSNGLTEWSDAPVLAQFTHGAPDDFRRGWGVKTLFRPFQGVKLGIHRPSAKAAKQHPDRLLRLTSQRWVNGSGRAMSPSFMEGGWRGSAATVGYELAEIKHFAVQSQEAYLLRADRGNVNLKPGKYDATYFAIFDRNEIKAADLSDWVPRVDDLVQAWLTDPALATLHDNAITWHRTRLTEILAAPGTDQLLEDLARAAEVPYASLDTLLFTQPLTPEGKRMVAELRAKGMPDATIAQAVALSVGKLEARRDAAEEAELRAMARNPSN